MITPYTWEALVTQFRCSSEEIRGIKVSLQQLHSAGPEKEQHTELQATLNSSLFWRGVLDNGENGLGECDDHNKQQHASIFYCTIERHMVGNQRRPACYLKEGTP